MPGALLPDDPATPAPADWYSPEELAVFRLSSKSHWDLPIDIDGRTVHFLVSHPTPPVFDGPEDRNGTRNFDEIRFWADYVTPGPTRPLHLRRRGRARAGCRRAPGSSSPATRTPTPSTATASRAPPSSCSSTRVNARSRRRAQGAVDAARCQGGANPTHRERPPVRHRRLRRHRARQPARRLRAARRGRCGSSTPACSGRRPTTRCSAWSATSRSRAPTTDWSGSTSPSPAVHVVEFDVSADVQPQRAHLPKRFAGIDDLDVVELARPKA